MINYYVEDESLSSTTWSTWQTKETLTFERGESANYLVIASAEIQGFGASDQGVQAQFTIDDIQRGYRFDHGQIVGTERWLAFPSAIWTNLDSSPHTLSLEYRSSDGSDSVSIRRARIIAVDIPDNFVQSSAQESQVSDISGNWVDVVSLTLADPADYLILVSSMAHTSKDHGDAEHRIYNSTTSSTLSYQYFHHTFLVFRKQFMMMAKINTSSSNEVVKFQHRAIDGWSRLTYSRIIAIKLGSPLPSYYFDSSDSLETSNTLIWETKISSTISPVKEGNALCLAYMETSDGTGGNNVACNARQLLNGSTINFTDELVWVLGTQYEQSSCYMKRNQFTGSNTFAIDFRSTANGNQVDIQRARLFQMELDTDIFLSEELGGLGQERIYKKIQKDPISEAFNLRSSYFLNLEKLLQETLQIKRESLIRYFIPILFRTIVKLFTRVTKRRTEASG